MTKSQLKHVHNNNHTAHDHKKKDRKKRGFTLIELIVIVVVIGILATIAALGLTAYQKQSRDAQRETDISVIAESLEKYYDLNGEYPSCASMTGTSSTVAGNLKIDESSLKAPTSTADNSFICSALTSGSSSGEYAYVGDGSATCQTGTSCLEWTIQYKSEDTGEIISIKSRRTSDLATSGAVSLTATPASNSQINLSWNAVPNTISYTVERSLNSGMTGATTSSVTTTSSSATGLNAGTRYYFRVTPVQTAQSGTPGTANAVTTISPPTGTVTTASSLQSSNTIARGTVSGATCSGGTTLQYAIGYDDRNANTAVSVAYGSWSGTTTRDVTAAQGYDYTFQSKARCVGPDATSTEIVGASTNITRPINQPSAPVYTGDASFLAGYRYAMTWSSSCPSGTSLVTGYIRMYNGGYAGNTGNNVYPGGGSTYAVPPYTEWWYLGWNAGQTYEEVFYYSYYSCQTYFTTSPQSPTGTQMISITCEAGRQSYSANPRCDNYGQSSSSLPWGP